MTAIIIEVSDKLIISTRNVWLCALCVAVMGFFLCRYSLWFAAIIFPFGLMLLFIVLLEMNDDPFIREAILSENGHNRWLVPLFALVPPTIGVILNVKDRKRKQTVG